MQRLLLLIICVSAAFETTAQTYHQSMYWLRYQALINFSPKVYWHNDVDNRRFFDPDVQSQLIVHSRLHYKTGRWDIASGLTYSVAYAAIPENGWQNPTAELRPVMEAQYELPIGKSYLSHRVRLDNRIFQEDPDESLFSESYYVMRWRYRIQLRLPLKKDEKNATSIGLRLADEIMVNVQENFFDQNRIYVIADFFANKKFSFSTEYIYIYQQRFGTEEYFSRNVIRLTLIQKINP